MKTARWIFDFYLKSSIHVSLAVTAFAGVTLMHLELEANPDLFAFIFFGSVTGYNFVKYASIAGLRHFNLSNHLRVIQVFSFFSFVGLIWFAQNLSEPVLWTAAFLGLLNILYALPVLGKEQNLRNITGVKVFIIAGIWCGVTVWLPILDSGLSFSTDIWVFTIQRFLFVVALTLPFDIRDIRFDTEQLGTIPQLIGVSKTRHLGLVLLLLVLILEFISPSADVQEIIVLVAITGITAFLLRKAVIGQTQYFASFWVESIPILWWVLLFIIDLIV